MKDTDGGFNFVMLNAIDNHLGYEMPITSPKGYVSEGYCILFFGKHKYFSIYGSYGPLDRMKILSWV